MLLEILTQVNYLFITDQSTTDQSPSPRMQCFFRAPNFIAHVKELNRLLKGYTFRQLRGGDMTHSQMLGKFEYTRGPIFKVVLEC